MNKLTSLTIATRESRLALWQAEHVKACLEAAHPGLTVKLLGMTTEGDQRLDVTLSKIGGKGLFVKELEAALHDGRADLAVHSLKDVPAELPQGFALACVMEREDPRDAFISNQYASLAALPEGAVVGTSSLRREVQIRAKYPSLKIVPLRGNLDTRFRKLDEGQYDAIILAYAGVKRLGLAARVKAIIERDEMLPAAAQGALGIEIRANRRDVAEMLVPLTHTDTMKIITAERAVLMALGGSCTMPLAAHCTPSPNGWKLKVVYGRDDGSLVRAEDECDAKSNLGAMRALGERVAEAIKVQGL